MKYLWINRRVICNELFSLKVAKKKCAEAERQLAVERTNGETLLKKVADLEEQLYAKNLELDSLNAKYGVMIESRDSQIRSLQVGRCSCFAAPNCAYTSRSRRRE